MCCLVLHTVTATHSVTGLQQQQQKQRDNARKQGTKRLTNKQLMMMITIGVQFTTRQDVPSQNAASGTENCIIRASVRRYRPRPCSVSPSPLSGHVRSRPAVSGSGPDLERALTLSSSVFALCLGLWYHASSSPCFVCCVLCHNVCLCCFTPIKTRDLSAGVVKVCSIC